MQPLPVVKDLDVIEQVLPHFVYCSILPAVKVLFFQTCEEALHTAVIIGAARLAHASLYVVLRFLHFTTWQAGSGTLFSSRRLHVGNSQTL